MLVRQQRAHRQNRWGIPVALAVLGALSVWQSFSEGSGGLAILLVVIALAIVGAVGTRRALRNIPKLLDELARRPAPADPRPMTRSDPTRPDRFAPYPLSAPDDSPAT